MRRKLLALAPFALLAACQDAPPSAEGTAQDAPQAATHGGTTDRSGMNEAQRAYAEANDRMHAAMGANISPDADVAFVQGMIPHHEGAIAMARIVLEHGTDPENRRLAQEIITAQQAEVVQMRAWLTARGAAQPAAADVPSTVPGSSSDAPVDHSKMGH